MTLNSYFLQGSVTEQHLIHDLITEQIQIYGVEVYYLPRKIFKTDNIIKEIQSSKFDDSFLLEAYVNNYDGYANHFVSFLHGILIWIFVLVTHRLVTSCRPKIELQRFYQC